MGRIAVLDENMINMIAAGEVIERPASVVKELLENSIDAGATKIVVNVEDGGRRLISITDDGCGMDADDLQKAFLPHATSKIRSADDLTRISTMGFRGEALASIASVSKVSVTSKTPDSIEACQINIDCGDKQPVRPASGAPGTSFEVRDLFYKLPARKKFLRTASTEMGHISEHFTRIALAHCDLDLTLIHNSRQVHKLVGGQSVKERIAKLFNKGVAADLIETVSEEKGVKIIALLGKPSASRATGKFQYVFLNKRFIRDKFITHATREAYRGLIEPNKYPMVFLFLEIDSQAFDVNVHPTKVEVRFDNSNMIHSQVMSVLREKLLSSDLDVSISIDRAASQLGQDPNTPASADDNRRQRISQAMADFFKTNKPVETAQQKFGFSGQGHRSIPASAGPANYSPAKEDFRAQPFEVDNSQTQNTAVATSGFLQIHDSYILTQNEDGFVIIDQHALHERIIYEELCRVVNETGLESQRLLIPETVEVSPADKNLVNDNAELIKSLGIVMEPFGPGTMAIHAFPTMLDKVSPSEFVRSMLDMLGDKSLGIDAEKLLHEVLDMAACKAAIKAGQSLSQDEMAQLLSDKEAVERASRCPHGRPTTLKFSISELEKQFKRTGF